MMRIIILILIWSVTCVADQVTEDFGKESVEVERDDIEELTSEFPCRDKKVGKVPLKFSISEKYKFNIEVTDRKFHSTADIVNLGCNKQSGLTRWESNGNKTYQWIFKNNFTFYVEDSGAVCNVSHDIPGSPMNFSASGKFLAGFKINSTWRGLVELLSSANMSNSSWYNESSTTIRDHSETTNSKLCGVSADQWTGCMYSSTNKSYLQFDVWHSKGESGSPKLPLLVVVKAYAANSSNSTVDPFKAHHSYEIFFPRTNYSIDDAETYLLPPRGVYCNGAEKTTNKSYPDMPDKFTVHGEYVGAARKRLDGYEVSYNGPDKLIGFTYTGEKEDIRFSTGLGLGKGRYKIVHDFLYGYQYALSDGGDKCESVKGIPSTAGDIVPAGKTGSILAMMNASELFLGSQKLNFSYVGMRTLDEGIPADVFIARNNTTSTVFEAWFTTANWSVSTVYSDFNKSVLLMLDVYHTSAAGVVSKSSQRFHSFTDLNGTSFPLGELDVSACLNQTKHSYVYLELDGTVEKIDKFGRERVKSSLREAIASLANISAVRIAEFYIDQTEDSKTDGKKLRLFFLLGDVNKEAPSPTLNQKKEISAEEAGNNLKKALKSDFTVKVTDFGRQTMDVVLLKESFYNVPADMHPSGGKVIDTGGYSGGSMAALGICMLLIGAVLGLVAAFYLWRRRGAGGAFAYQVYE